MFKLYLNKYVIGGFEQSFFLIKNFIYFKRLKKFKSIAYKNIIIRAFSVTDLKKFNEIYKKNSNKLIGLKLKTLLLVTGKRSCFVAADTKNSIIGVIFFYFNRRDAIEGTVHEAFIGILPEWQGKGVGKALRKYAIQYFFSNGLKGISSRVNISNYASFNINKRLGYKIVEKYFDSDLNEIRVYMRLFFLDNNE